MTAGVNLCSLAAYGLVFSNRDSKTLLDKLVALVFSITHIWSRSVVLVANAYYASGKVIKPLLGNGHHLVTRAKTNAVAYLPVPKVKNSGKGRPRIYGQKVHHKELAGDDGAFTSAPSPVYGQRDVVVRFRVLGLLWKPIGRMVRSCIVHHPLRGTIFLLSTDTSLAPLEILQLYGYRFKIELRFRQAEHVIGAYAHHFWMAGMKPLRQGAGDQYLHRTSDEYRAGVRRKLCACHVHNELGCIAQGLLQHLATNHTAEVWRCFRSWLRTMNPAMPPSALIRSPIALRSNLPIFIAVPALAPDLTKIMAKYHRHDPPSKGNGWLREQGVKTWHCLGNYSD